ncbi:hypothetical protein C8R46DRAFT_477264 [Mycena filopes]|nr:hypothetical protein C8R46DRAFT_477264 [Mycena filopes]
MVAADTCPGLFHQDKGQPDSRGGFGCSRTTLHRSRCRRSAAVCTLRKASKTSFRTYRRVGWSWSLGLCPYRPGLHLHQLDVHEDGHRRIWRRERMLTRVMTASSPTRVPQGRLKTVGYRCGRATRPLTSTWVLFAGALQRKLAICDSVLECSVCGVPCFRWMLVLLSLLDANSSPSERWRRTLLGASLERCLLQNPIPVRQRRQWSYWGCT